MPEDDALLRVLTQLLNGTEPGNEASITFLTQGLVVSGTLVAPEAYAAGMAQSLGSSPDEKVRDFAGFFEGGQAAMRERRELYQFRRVTEGDDAPRGAPGDEFEDLTAFVHMRDAKVISAAGAPIVTGVWIRIRVSDVNAWFLGTIDRGN